MNSRRSAQSGAGPHSAAGSLAHQEDRPGEDRPGEDLSLKDPPLEDRPLEDRPLEDRPLEDRPLEDRPLEDRSLEELIDLWSREHVDLTHRAEATQRWLAQIRQQRGESYTDLATQLKGFRQWLLGHFEREEQLGEHLQRVRDCVEMTASRRQIASDHQHLARRIDMLIQRLEGPAAPFDTFEQAVEDAGLFIDAFELHEEQETQCLQWLAARPLEMRKLPR